MKTSRQRLLEYIQAQRVVSAGDLALALRMTEANARHHLALLEADGLVQVIGQRPAPGKGRPARLYGLSEQALGSSLPQLSAALLDELLAAYGPEARLELLQRAAVHLSRDLKPAPRASAALSARLVEAVQRLQALHYQARWEARPAAPRLILGRCPYRPLLPAHPELCRFDAALLQALLGAPVEQTAMLVSDGKGLMQCVFEVRQETKR